MDIIALLQDERKKVKAELDRVECALNALGKAGRRGFKKIRKMSAAGRRRISLAQKARWAKVKKAIK